MVFHQNVCENYIGSVYVGGYCGLSESGLLSSVDCVYSAYYVWLYSVLDTLVISGEDVCYSVALWLVCLAGGSVLYGVSYVRFFLCSFIARII